MYTDKGTISLMKMRMFRSKVIDLLEMKGLVTFLGLFLAQKVIDLSKPS